MLKTVGNPSARTGDQTIVDGNLVIGTSGKGIDFSADPSAAGMTSELFDDYEEGTWTPTLTTSGTDYESVTYDTNTSGYYVKVGNVVHIQLWLRTTGLTLGSASGNAMIGNLPFVSKASESGKLNGTGAFAVGRAQSWSTAQPSEATIDGNTNKIALFYRATADGASATMAASYATAGTANRIQIAGTYIAA